MGGRPGRFAVRSSRETLREPEPVWLNVYDLGNSCGIQVMNSVLGVLGTGAFHCGIEVFGREWSFEGGRQPGTGVFVCRPKCCAGHSFYESLLMGEITLCQDELASLVRLLEASWPARAYHVLSRNCCHFCETFCAVLGVGPVPPQFFHLAKTVEQVEAQRKSLLLQMPPCSCCCTTPAMPLQDESHHMAWAAEDPTPTCDVAVLSLICTKPSATCCSGSATRRENSYFDRLDEVQEDRPVGPEPGEVASVRPAS